MWKSETIPRCFTTRLFVRKSDEQKEKDWEFTVKMMCIIKDLMNGNPNLPEGREEETVGHNAILHACDVDDNVLVGMGAILMDGVHIKSNSVVAAGAIVTQDKEFPEGSLIVGAPARVVRELTEDEIRKFHENAEHYIVVKDILMDSAEHRCE